MDEVDLKITLLEQAKRFKALGTFLEKNAKTEHDRVQAKICYGLAEVSMGLANTGKVDQEAMEKLEKLLKELPKETTK